MIHMYICRKVGGGFIFYFLHCINYLGGGRAFWCGCGVDRVLFGCDLIHICLYLIDVPMQSIWPWLSYVGC